MAAEIIFTGSLGALLGLSFVILEMFLLPLFEYTSECLAIATVRDRIAQRKIVQICPEREAAIAFGLSDGLSGDSSYIVVLRALKVVFKVSLMVSVFMWEFQLDTVYRRPLISLQFNMGGPRGPANESSVMFPIPIVGIPEQPTSHSATQGPFIHTNYSSSILPGLYLDFAARCTSEENGTRSVYLAIYSKSGLGRRKIQCLNGIDSLEKAEILTYNRIGTPVRSNISFLVLEKKLPSIDNDKLFFSGKITVLLKDHLTGRTTVSYWLFVD